MIRLFARSYPKWIALSEDYVYWNEEGTVNVMRGPKTGGTVEEVGPWSGVGAIFAVDETHIYWLNDDRILKREHQGGPITEIPLGASYLRGSIFGYADMLYVADTGCRTILRVAKQGGSPTVTQVSGAELLGGVTRVIVDANDLYCGAGGAGKIYAQPRAGGEVRTFLSGQDSVGAMALDETTLYWVNNRGNLGLRLQNLALASRTDGVASDLGTVMPAGHAAFLNLDQARRTLYWVTGISAQLPLMKYSLDDRAFTAVADKRWMRGGFAADRDYLYWTEDDAIMKMAK